MTATAASARDADVIIVGAGAAGLAAAGTLDAEGRRVIVLEARDRIGGRIFTRSVRGAMVPIELGAEFLHGRASAVRDIASPAGLRTVDIAPQRYTSIRNRLTHHNDFGERLDRVFKRLDPRRDPDRSFAEALRAHRRSLGTADRAMASQFVEGFDAADPELISERAVAITGSPREDPTESRIGRLVDGYGALAGVLARPVAARIRLGAVVTRVRWKPGRVDVEYQQAGGRTRRVAARALIVTVPLAVLQAEGVRGAIAFDPPLGSLGRAAALGVMGHVVKLVLQFDQAFWLEPRFVGRRGLEDFDRMSFLQSRRRLPFSVWWSSYPVASPVLVAWSGGPRARAMARGSVVDIQRAAIDSLAGILTIGSTEVRRHLVSTSYHDWSEDPFSRGAYSYPAVGGYRLPRRLAAPVRRTIWYAGEAADELPSIGTVHAAIASGQRAARDILGA